MTSTVQSIGIPEKDSVQKRYDEVTNILEELVDSKKSIDRVMKILTREPLGRSVAKEIFAHKKSSLIFDAIAEQMEFKIRPIFSDAEIKEDDIFHQFQVWLIGLMKGLKIRYPRELFSGDYDSCEIETLAETCGECDVKNSLALGTRVDDSISAKTLLILVLENFNCTNFVSGRIVAVEQALKVAIEVESLYHECASGRCESRKTYDDEEDESDCRCYEDFEGIPGLVRTEVLNFFNSICVDPFFDANSHLIREALENYVPHPAMANASLRSAFCRKPDEEKRVKEELAAKKKEVEEAIERDRREHLARVKAHYENGLKEVKKQLGVKRKKDKKSASNGGNATKKAVKDQ